LGKASLNSVLKSLIDPTLLLPGRGQAKLGYIGIKLAIDLLPSAGKQYLFHFKDAINKAKLTGRLVAISLALGFPFSTQTISMIGFSLGTQVIKSCLSTLHKLGAHDIINNVTLLAGASHYEKNQEKWESVFNSVIGGEIKNGYSKGDWVLA
jgi:hypothetical protein